MLATPATRLWSLKWRERTFFNSTRMVFVDARVMAADAPEMVVLTGTLPPKRHREEIPRRLQEAGGGQRRPADVCEGRRRLSILNQLLWYGTRIWHDFGNDENYDICISRDDDGAMTPDKVSSWNTVSGVRAAFKLRPA